MGAEQVTTKLCVVCSTPYQDRPQAKTFEERRLCDACIKVWAERDARYAGYRKDA